MSEVRVPNMRGRSVVFVPNYPEFKAFMLSGQMRDVTVEVARDIAGTAAVMTPVGDGEDGHMRDKWSVQPEGGSIKVNQAFRVMVLVENDDPASPLVEFGAANNKRRRIAARAGAKFGDLKLGKKGEL